MKPILILILLLFFSHCADIKSFIITKENIKVVKDKQHPFLVDHSKKITVVKDEKMLFEVEAYMDPGSGCKSYLFEEEKQFILIECNGNRYTIEKNGGKIIKDKWAWMEPLPTNYIGTFVRNKGKEYELLYTPPKELEEVYIFKDPR